MISVKKLNGAVLLQKLHENAGKMPYDQGEITVAKALDFIMREAQKQIKRGVIPNGFSWDYVYFRPIKVVIDKHGNLTGEELYDRDAPGGPGTCARIVAELHNDARAQDPSTGYKEWEREFLKPQSRLN